MTQTQTAPEKRCMHEWNGIERGAHHASGDGIGVGVGCGGRRMAMEPA
ncbi:hypothetical protein A3768_3238 [Ralstonia solanacearum]|nr:hypothetical protein A3768_3238 [Ralstonia solanacearum]